MSRISRRRFLKCSAGGIAGLGAGSGVLSQPKLSRAASANDRIVMALIGCGGRGSSVARNFAARPDVEFACVCDVDPTRGVTTPKQLASRRGRTVKRVEEYERVFEDKDIDAVIVATPDHWHGPATVYACQAGKDVYVEKPPSHNVWEGRKMVEAARKYRRIVQVGTQNRSEPYVHRAFEYVQGDALGKIHLCKVFNLKSGGPHRQPPDSNPPPGLNYDRWLGPAPKRPFNRAHFHGGWHAYWAYSGGDMADDGVHQLDLARWLVGTDFPKAVHCSGGHLAWKDDREVPDTQVVTYDFDDLVMTFELTQWARYMSKTPGEIRGSDTFPYWPQNATRIELYGTKQLMIIGRHGGGWQVFTRDGKVVAQDYGRPGDRSHRDDFVSCVRSRKRPNADIEEGHRSACLVHLANVSYRVGGQKLTFDAKTESFVGHEPANRLLKRTYRKPYAIPEDV